MRNTKARSHASPQQSIGEIRKWIEFILHKLKESTYPQECECYFVDDIEEGQICENQLRVIGRMFRYRQGIDAILRSCVNKKLMEEILDSGAGKCYGWPR